MQDELREALETLDPTRIDFSGALVALEDERDASARGRWFEKLFAALLKRDGLTAWHNPRAAHPRQTDIGFEVNGTVFLVETKWRRLPADVNDLESLRSRVGRCPPGTAGCLVSIEGFTSSLSEDLREHRTNEIVLIDGEEVRAAVLGEASLLNLIAEKRKRFRVDGEVWFARDDEQRRAPIVLPPARYSIRDSEGEIASVVTRTGHHPALHYFIDILQLETYWQKVHLERSCP